MTDLSKFDPNSAGNPNNNIFGLPFTEEEARLIVLAVPWEVTVSYNAGTARSAEHIFKASLQVDLMIQWRNFNIDPDWYLGRIGCHETGEILGVKQLMEAIHVEFPHLKFGYFNPPMERIKGNYQIDFAH